MTLGGMLKHLAIVEALQQSDADLAVKAMARHLRSGVRYWNRALPNGDHNGTGTQRKPKKVSQKK